MAGAVVAGITVVGMEADGVRLSASESLVLASPESLLLLTTARNAGFSKTAGVAPFRSANKSNNERRGGAAASSVSTT